MGPTAQSSGGANSGKHALKDEISEFVFQKSGRRSKVYEA